MHEAGVSFKKKVSLINETLGLIPSERMKKEEERDKKRRERGRERKKCLVNHYVSLRTVQTPQEEITGNTREIQESVTLPTHSLNI